jgi:SEC-C motif-containing protein
MTCPCNPHKAYHTCCAIAHKNIYEVKTAEQLMRSRYSAFVLGNVDYLQRSHHSAHRPNRKEACKLKKWTEYVNWIQLEILQTHQGVETDSTGSVIFKAFYMEKARVEVIHEHSRFCKENGHWVYLDAKN